jgi:hypothetical protein
VQRRGGLQRDPGQAVDGTKGIHGIIRKSIFNSNRRQSTADGPGTSGAEAPGHRMA